MPALRLPRIPVALVASVLFVVASPAAVHATTTGDVGWTVQTVDNDNGSGRGSFSYELDPGGTLTDAMRVVNTGTAALPLDVYAADAFTTAGGDIDLVTGGSPSTDAGLWVSVDAPQIVLQPGEQTDIAFTITVPADAAPGDHAAGLVTSLVSQDDNQTLAVDRRLGTRVNVRVTGALLPGAAVENVRTSFAPSWNPFEAGTLVVDYTVRNAGNTRLTGADTVSAAGPAGLLATVATAQRTPEITPGSAVEVRRELQVVSLGWLSGTVELSPEAVGLGAGNIAPVAVAYSAGAVPWSLVILLGIIAGGVVAAVLLVRSRRRIAGEPAVASAPSGAQGQQG
ncbi:WxL protein peptidoglycan domain-containing protein [Microbacterium sp. P06]|uniref:WxL protein peptidoglycan domain-containing protein n=1 Tax=Microbacterium sp. P06 TaxID=3366949 RepID=UPI0037464309